MAEVVVISLTWLGEPAGEVVWRATIPDEAMGELVRVRHSDPTFEAALVEALRTGFPDRVVRLVGGCPAEEPYRYLDGVWHVLTLLRERHPAMDFEFPPVALRLAPRVR